MKNTLIYILFIAMALSACNIEDRKPEFKRFENLNVKSISSTIYDIDADVIVYNPNSISVYLNNTDIDVFANEVKISTIKQTNKTEVSKKSEFSIPLKANLSLKDLVKNESSVLNIINSSLSAYKDKKIDLKFIGTAEFEVGGIKFDIPIEYDEVVNLKK
ncbi:MAG: LEA type 2 family protein [Chitinophagales bacterium]